MVEFIKHQKRFKRKTKKGHHMEPIDATNIERFSAFMNMFATWLDDWMSSGKSGFSKQTFLSCIQTSRSFPLLVQHLLGTKQLSYILTGNMQSDPLEKRFGRFRQLSGTNYFGSVKQFLDAEKSIRVRSLIKFSGYTMKEVHNILQKDDSKAQAQIDLYASTVAEIMLHKSDLCNIAEMDRDIVYYVAGFISRSVKKTINCSACCVILGSNSDMKMEIEV